MYPDRPDRVHRAFGLAYPAANAKFFINIRLQHIFPLYRRFFQYYGFFMCGAMFLTDKARRPILPRRAYILVNLGYSQFGIMLLFYGYLRNGSGRTYLSAKPPLLTNLLIPPSFSITLFVISKGSSPSQETRS